MAGDLPSTGSGSQQADMSRRRERMLMAMRAWWRRLARGLAGGYRPERHYMRGPGPKALERNSRTAR